MIPNLGKIAAMTTLINSSQACLCGSGLTYQACCGVYHDGEQLPKTAADLMRSRFTAYAMRNADYLIASWDSSKRPANIDFSKETAEWQSLSIISTKKGSATDSKGVVEFKAFYQQDGVDYFMHEISRFVKNGQRWQYLDGVVKAVNKVGVDTNTGKNAPCACGSGKKFKRCCGA